MLRPDPGQCLLKPAYRFGGNPGTGLVTVQGSIPIGGLQFDMGGYQLSGGTLLLSPTYQSAATVEIRAVLERALDTAEGRAHPGVLHLYIHLMEMSPQPEEALWVGELPSWCAEAPGDRPKLKIDDGLAESGFGAAVNKLRAAILAAAGA